MLLVVPQGSHAARLGNEAQLIQIVEMKKGSLYSLTFSMARTCAQMETGSCRCRLYTTATGGIHTHPTMHFLTMQGDGVILHCSSLICPTLFTSTLQSIERALSLLCTKGCPTTEGEESGSRTHGFYLGI